MAPQILVVEDEKIIAKDIQRTLQGLGYVVPAPVATGDAAIEKVEELRPDLVLMDIRLRGAMDGIVTANVIRDRWNVPIVYLTAHADPGTLERAKISEPFGYVLKPFDERDLHTTIEMALYKHQIDRKLRESERWLSVTLNSIGDAVLATSEQGDVVFINPVAQALIGYSAKDAIGRPLAEIFHIINEQTRAPVDNPVAKVLATGVTVGLANHTVLIARDGSERPIDDSAAPIRGDAGEILGVVLIFRDISERREAENALRRSEHELSEFFENATVGLHWVGLDGTILRVNQAELDMLGYSREEYVGRNIAAFHVDQPVIEDILARLVRGEDLREYPARMRAKDGSIRHVLINSNGLFEDGQFIHSRCFTRDVTEQKRVNQRLAAQDAVTRALAESATLESAAPRIIEAMCELLDWSIGVLWYVDPKSSVLECAAACNLPSVQAAEFLGDLRERTFEPGAGLPGRVWASGEPAWVPDVTKDNNFSRALLADTEGLHAACGFPIRLNNEVLGVIEFFSHEIRQPNGDLLQMMAGFGAQIGQFIDGKRAEAALRDSERKFKTLTSHAPVGIFQTDAVGNCLFVNERWCEIAGISLDAALGQGWAAALHAEDRDRIRRQWYEAAEREREFVGEYRFQTPDGNVTWVSGGAMALYDAKGQTVGYIGTVTDITERKLIEEALREQKENLETLLDTVPIGVYIAHDPLCRRITGNRAATELLRLSRDANLSKSAPPDERPTHYRVTKFGREIPPDELPFQRAARGEVVRAEEVDHEFDDGTIIHTLISAQPLYDATGRPRGAVGSVLDITEIKNAEAALRHADRRKDEFLATLAHELRNPLAPIQNALEMMKLTAEDGELAVGARQIMQRQLVHLVRLVDDLLDVSRITRDKLELRLTTVELSSIVHQAIEACRPLIDELHHDLTVNLPMQPIYLNADAVRLTQMFANLVNNASKYSEPHSRLSITAQRHGTNVNVTVKDNGIGIAPEMLPKVFDMFEQVDQSSNSKGGLGIGLTLVRRLVEMHGGSVAAHSEGIGYGSEFAVSLPILEEMPELSTEPAAPRTLAGYRILVVDDNVDAAKSLSLLLKKTGNDVCTAHDGVEAVAAAERFRPDILLLDIGLPKMNGYDVCREIRQQPWGGDMILVALTGWGQETDRRRSAEAGFDGHLVKPVEHRALIEILRQLDVGHSQRRKMPPERSSGQSEKAK
jgi:PAS domain S-box-containing protein